MNPYAAEWKKNLSGLFQKTNNDRSFCCTWFWFGILPLSLEIPSSSQATLLILVTWFGYLSA